VGLVPGCALRRCAIPGLHLVHLPFRSFSCPLCYSSFVPHCRCAAASLPLPPLVCLVFVS
jgi:hypothetical protein